MSNSVLNESADQSKQASFDWALNGSWVEFEKELDRVLHKKAIAIPKAPPSLMSVIGDKLAPAVQAFNSAPDWGKGALIGAGAGALGGLLTDKKKRLRGLLQGALVGGGLGALGGYGYNKLQGTGASGSKPNYEQILGEVGQFPKTLPPLTPAPAPTAEPTTAAPTAATLDPLNAAFGSLGKSQPAAQQNSATANAAANKGPGIIEQITNTPAYKGISDALGYTGDALGFAASNPITLGLGSALAGKKLYASGNKTIQEATAGLDPTKIDRKTTVMVRPSDAAVRNSIQGRPDIVNDLVTRQLMDQQIKGKDPHSTVGQMSRTEAQTNWKNYLDPRKHTAQGVPITIAGAAHHIPAGSVEAQQQKLLANQLGKASLPSKTRARISLGARKGFGALLGLGGLATSAYGVADGVGRAADSVRNTLRGGSELGALPAFQPVFDGPGGKGQQALEVFINAALKTANPAKEIADMAQRSGWSEEATRHVIKRIKGMQP